MDHLIGVEKGGPTTYYNLGMICAWHHYLKTHHHYRLKWHRGHWLWSDSGDPPDQEQLELKLKTAGWEGTLLRPEGADFGASARGSADRLKS